VPVSTFSDLRRDLLATALPLFVVSLDAMKLFAAAETRRNAKSAARWNGRLIV
jgi:hypothetical protein